MIYVLLFFVVLSVLVVIHELGHFFAARAFGIKAEEFGFGFPPRIMGFVRLKKCWHRVKPNDQKKYANTIWSINWLPLGGFVRLKDEQAEGAGDEDSFIQQPPLTRFIVLSAGVIMNWILAAFILSAGLAVGVPMQLGAAPSGAIVQQPKVQIQEVLPDSAAQAAGLEPGDDLLSINHQTLTNTNLARQLLQTNGSPVVLEVGRGEMTFSVNATPRYLAPLGHPGLGIVMADVGIVRFPWYSALFQGFGMALRYTQLIFASFGDLVRDLIIHQQVSAELSGPVGIAVMSSKIARLGFWPFAQFVALLSLNLAIVNVLPIPALDGGRILFVFVEALRSKKLNQRIEGHLHQAGFVFLLVLILLVTVKDLHQYGPAILGYLKRG